MDNILKLAISAGLKFLGIYDDINTNDIPTNTFGVFVGVERSEHHKLNMWPFDIHGCIGYWDPLYHNMDKSNIIDKIKAVAFSAVWEDHRKNYFKYSIYVDPNSKFKIYFMLNPIMEINSANGIIANGQKFNNKIYGLIVEDSNGIHSATYLPQVFPDKSWKFIKQSLIQKANIKHSHIKFYAYNCQIFSMTIADYFFGPVQNFFNKYYTNFVPHSIINDKIFINESDTVRNLGTIYDILQMKSIGYYFDKQTLDAIIQNVDYYKNKYNDHPDEMRQALPFLLLSIKLINTNDTYIYSITKYLYEQLILQKKYMQGYDVENFKPMDMNFELGEILMALNKIDPTNKITIEATNHIPTTDTNISTGTDIDIFRYNWFSQSAKNIKNKIYKYILTKKIINFIDTKKYDETNFLAVEFESLATLYSIIGDEPTKMRIEVYLAELIIKLEQIKNRYGFYQFKNNEARIDITGHVLNGLISLLSS